MHHLYLSAYNKLSQLKALPVCKVAAGFDGFIDIISRPILSVSNDTKEYFPTISSFGKYITGKSSMSCSIEIDTIDKRIGGNMPNFISSLSSLGISCDCIGAFGYPDINNIFNSLGNNVFIKSVAEIGKCNALEFNDGKLFLADNNDLNKLDYKLLIERAGFDYIKEWITCSDMLALFNWSELPGISSVWRGLLDDILPHVLFENKKYMLIDISDCSKRPPAEIRQMGEMLNEFGKYYDVMLSLNLNELLCVNNAIGGTSKKAEEAGCNVYKSIKPCTLSVHLTDGVLLYENNDCMYVPTKKITSPKISTGGGDNFNAGLAFALICGLNYPESAAVANAESSFYVAHGRCASYDELLIYIKNMDI